MSSQSAQFHQLSSTDKVMSVGCMLQEGLMSSLFQVTHDCIGIDKMARIGVKDMLHSLMDDQMIWTEWSVSDFSSISMCFNRLSLFKN